MVLVGNYSDSESLDKRLPDFLELSDTTKVDREARMRNLCERLILKVSQCLRGRVQFASGSTRALAGMPKRLPRPASKPPKASRLVQCYVAVMTRE